MTKWIKFPGLPMEFFTRSCVKAIISSFAHFLNIYDHTYLMNSLQCARPCVELDVAKQVPPRVWISAGDQSFFQDIVVEGGLAYCTKCKIHGYKLLQENYQISLPRHKIYIFNVVHVYH